MRQPPLSGLTNYRGLLTYFWKKGENMGEYVICEYAHPSDMRRAIGVLCYESTRHQRRDTHARGRFRLGEMVGADLCVFLPASEEWRCSRRTTEELAANARAYGFPIYDTVAEVLACVAASPTGVVDVHTTTEPAQRVASLPGHTLPEWRKSADLVEFSRGGGWVPIS